MLTKKDSLEELGLDLSLINYIPVFETDEGFSFPKNSLDLVSLEVALSLGISIARSKDTELYSMLVEFFEEPGKDACVRAFEYRLTGSSLSLAFRQWETGKISFITKRVIGWWCSPGYFQSGIKQRIFELPFERKGNRFMTKIYILDGYIEYLLRNKNEY